MQFSTQQLRRSETADANNVLCLPISKIASYIDGLMKKDVTPVR